MEDGNKDLNRCIEKLVWDFIDIHGFASGRKSEITLIASIIVFLASRKRIQMKEVAETLDVSNSTVTDYINYLENKGFVRRVRSDQDRREVFIEITETGKGWMARNKQTTMDYIEGCMSRLNPEEREAFIRLLVKFAGDLDGPPYDVVGD